MMRIAQVAPLSETVPPQTYGGVERVVADLTDCLVGQGHEVTLFAAGGSRTSARLKVGRPINLRADKSVNRHDLAAHINMLAEVLSEAERFDVIHFHTELLQFPMFERCRTPCITTVHTQPNRNDARTTFAHWPNHRLVALSDAQRSEIKLGNWVGTIHNGIPADRFSYGDGSKGYLAFLGRFSPDKGAHLAIKTAIELGVPLYLAARLDAANMQYFDQHIRPFLDHPLINYIGEVDDRTKQAFLGEAAALLFPITWSEPFGLVLIEAMACGTPVAALDRGSVREIVDPAATGVIAENEGDFTAAVRLALRIDRKKVRSVFARRFTSEIMGNKYANLYRTEIRMCATG